MHWRKLGKALSILSALTLGSIYIGCRMHQSAPENETEAKSSSDPLILPSSKNPNQIFDGKSIQQKRKPPVVLPSSKHIDGALRSSDFLPFEEDPPPSISTKGTEKQLELLPSSKIGGIFRPSDIKPKRESDLERPILDPARRKLLKEVEENWERSAEDSVKEEL